MPGFSFFFLYYLFIDIIVSRKKITQKLETEQLVNFVHLLFFFFFFRIQSIQLHNMQFTQFRMALQELQGIDNNNNISILNTSFLWLKRKKKICLNFLHFIFLFFLFCFSLPFSFCSFFRLRTNCK